MSAHTPGPWEIRKDIPYSDGLVVFHGRWEENVTVCRLWHSNKDTQQANARLIAAAPQMYEALKVAAVVMEENGLSRAAGALRTVIAAAEGEATNGR